MRKQKGITLIALVITIIVLILLAGVTISALLGDDGIVEQAGIAEENTNQQGEIEQIQMAYNAELIYNKSEKLGAVTKEQLYDRLKSNGANLAGDGEEEEKKAVKETQDGFEIEFEGGRKYSINITNKDVTYVGGGTGNGGATIPSGMYSVNEKVTPAPQEIFNVEKINEETARITGIKTEYVRRVAKEHYYHIEHDDIDKTLVVPYEVAIDDKKYTVTEVSLDCENTVDVTQIINEIDGGYGVNMVKTSIPDISEVIYPNTVKRIYSNLTWKFWDNNYLEEVVLPNNLESIGNSVFAGCSKMKSFNIPNSVTSIGDCAFAWCTGLTSIIIPNSVTSIGENAFRGCTKLNSITIPNSVTSIGSYAFEYCDNLEIVKFETETLPTLGYDCFYKYSGKQITYYFKNADALKSFWGADDSKIAMDGEYYYYQ